MRSFWLLAPVVLIAWPAQADPAADVAAEVARCSDIAGAVERLDCYDKAAAVAKTAMSSSPAPAPGKSQQAQAQAEEEEGEGGVLSWFGLENKRKVTKPEDFGKPPAPAVSGPKEVTQISSNVLELARNAYGRSIFILDNGQVWKQVDGDQAEVRDPSKGETMKVTIEKGLFGSYSLYVDGRRGLVKVRRVK